MDASHINASRTGDALPGSAFQSPEPESFQARRNAALPSTRGPGIFIDGRWVLFLGLEHRECQARYAREHIFTKACEFADNPNAWNKRALQDAVERYHELRDEVVRLQSAADAKPQGSAISPLFVSKGAAQ
jgi:hypothetical protein